MIDLREFQIGAWHGLGYKQISERTVREVKDAGFTLVLPPGWWDYLPKGSSYVAENTRLLDICSKIGVKAVLFDIRIENAFWKEGSIDLVKQAAQDYRNHPGLYGYYLTDEPSAMLFPHVAEMVRLCAEGDPNHLPMVNILPTYGGGALGTESYQEYVRRYIDEVKPHMVCYDNYHWFIDPKAPPIPNDQGEAAVQRWLKRWGNTDTGLNGKGYITNLEIVRNECRRAKLPMWVTAQLVPQDRCRDPRPPELRWDAYHALAYGAKGMLWYNYCLPPRDQFLYRDSCLDRDGRKTQNYYEISQINHEIYPIGSILAKLDSTKVMHVGAEPEPVTRFTPSLPLLNVRGESLTIGMFTKEHLLVVNKLLDRKSVATVELASGWHLERFDGLRKRFESSRTNSFELLPGGAVLLRMVRG